MNATTKRWLRRIGIAVGVLVVLVAIGLWWLLDTTSGLRFALSRATAASNGAISVKAAHGDLAGPTQLEGVSYQSKSGVRLHVDHVKANIDLWSLLAGNVHFVELDARGVDIAKTTPANPPPELSAPMSLEPPINLVLDDVHVSGIHISRDGKPVLAVNTLDLAGSWTAQGLSIKHLDLRAPKGQVQLAGEIHPGQHISGKGHGQFRWTLDNGTTWGGALQARSDGSKAHLIVSITRPMTATLHLAIEQSGKLPWTVTLDAPTFDAKPLLNSSSIKTLALALQGHGNRHGGTLTGQITVNQTRLRLQPLTLHYDPDTQIVHLDQLVLVSPDIEGKLAGSGTVDLGAQPVAANLALHWNNVVLPKQLAGQKLASTGHITLDGNADHYRVKGDIMVGPPDRQAHLTLDLTGTPRVVTLDHLTINQPHGHLTTHGKITLKPRLAWDLVVKGEDFNPGLLLAGWKGALDLKLTTQGRLMAAGPKATFKLAKLGGQLRQRSVDGHGTLHVQPDRVIDGQLMLSSGDSRVELKAHGKQRNHIDVHLAIASLNDWLPDASGAVNGDINVDGLWPALAVKADLHGNNLGMGTRRVDTLKLTADVPDISHPGGTLKLDAHKLVLGRLAFDTVRVTGKGDAAHHTLHLTAEGKPLSLTLALTGSMHGKAWTGRLSTLKLDVQGLPPWRLQQPAQLAWNKGKASLSTTCLTAGTPVLCVSAKKTRDGAMQTSYRLQQTPLALIATAAGQSLPLSTEGVINGQGKLSRSAAGQLTGHATLRSPSGSITYVDRPKQPLLAYRNFKVDANLTPGRKHVTLAATFSHGGHLAGDISITGANKALSGQIAIRLDSLAPIELFTNMLANVKGHLDAHFRLDGTLAKPSYAGQATLQQFAAEVPVVGLKLHDGQFRVATTDTRQLRIDGHIDSGKGTLKVSGMFGLGHDTATQLHIGGNNVLVADIPAAHVVITPDLTIKRTTKLLAVTGQVTVDKALIKVEKLPGGGVTHASPDVVVVDSKKKEKQSNALPLRVDITVNLDDHTHLIGYGLDGHVSGKLHVRQEPGGPTLGRGQIVINGTYKAFGQDLDIKQGRLLFAGTPIANPGLDIRAVRALHPNATINDHEVVGVQISGTAQQPVLTVFSNPPMSQSDALSYLITGKPLSAVRGGEGNLVNAAAQALGSAAGDLLAKNIGAKLGIQASVSSSEALGTAAFTVGKYLSPKLYLSYGVGLFAPGQVITLRYILSQRWNFEAEQATDFSRGSFNYRLER